MYDRPARWTHLPPLGLVWFCLALLSGLLLTPRTARAELPPIALPPGFVEEVISDKLDGPTAFALAPDGRIFVAQKAGAVRVIHNGRLQPGNFIDVSYQVNQYADRGLLGIAVHPRWPAMPYVYLAYVYEPPEAPGHKAGGARVARVTRVTANPSNLNVALPDSEVVLLGQESVFGRIGNPDQMDKPPLTCKDADGSDTQDCLPVEGSSHTVTQLVFGPEGALYVGNGDGIDWAPANLRAQDVDSLAGKILRIDPMTGAGYPGNPFSNGNPHANRSKVWALGLRNPWRFTFGPEGALWVADVGNFSWESIGRGRAGANFGWPCYEGPQPAVDDPICQALFDGKRPVTPAVFAYPHAHGRGAVIGGDFYRGRVFPAQYRGRYFFADYNTGTIDYLDVQDGQVQDRLFASNAFGPVQITYAPDGTLYWLSIVRGALSRIRFVADSNTPPTPVAVASPAPPRAGVEEAAPIVEPEVVEPEATTPAAPRVRPPTGASSLETVPAPEGGARILLLTSEGYTGAWSVVQWQDGRGHWHDVEGWRGHVEGGRKRWWVGPELYGHGPFRWVLYGREGGPVLATSEPFDLPTAPDRMLVWTVGR